MENSLQHLKRWNGKEGSSPEKKVNIKESQTLIEIQPLIDIITLALQSVFIKSERNGVSLLLIASPETARTTSLHELQSSLDFVCYYDEITQKLLLDEFLDLVKDRRKRTLIIPDLVNCIEKQRSTREQFLNIIKSGIDDTGVTRISTYYKRFSSRSEVYEGTRFNLITAITSDSLYIGRPSPFYKMKQSGLLSRFLPFSYHYPIDKIAKILKMIQGQNVSSKVTYQKINEVDVEIPKSPELFQQFELLSRDIGTQAGALGLRAQTILQRLAMSHAWLNGRNYVAQGDIDKVFELSKWMNFKFNPI